MAWDSLPSEDIRQIVINAAAEYAGMAGGALFAAARGWLDARNAPQKQRAAVQDAIQRALQEALQDALLLLVDDGAGKDFVEHYAAMLGNWLARPAVAQQYAGLIAPGPTTDLDMDLLRDEFEAANLHFSADDLGQPFATVADTIGERFVTSAAWEDDLQEVIAIGEQRRMGALLERMAPLDLDQLGQHYLNRVYGECNALPLADVEKGRTQPRLQRVFVDVRVRDAVPTYAQAMARLGLFGYRRARAGRLVQEALTARGDERTRMAHDPRRGPASDDDEAGWVPAVRQMDDETFGKLAAALSLEADELRRALENLTPLEVLAEQPAPRLVLLGDPGSGKSTLTRRWAGLLAALGQPVLRKEWTEDEELAADELLRVFDRWLLPVRVVLSQWAQRLPDNGPGGATGCAGDLAAECWHVWSRVADLHGDSAARQHFHNKLVGDRPAVLLLLDGLDEVTDPTRRTTLLQAVRDFAVTYPSVPMVVTSRVRPYDALQRQGEALDWTAATLDKLTPQAIDHFVGRWHAELVATHEWEARQAGVRRAHLTAALADTRRAELREMAGTPLLLTMMVKVNYKERLPDSRAELYETFVRQLLFEWERRRSIEGGEHTDLDRLLQEAKIPEDQFEYRLNGLAYSIHEGADRDSVDIPADSLRRTLMALYLGDLDEDEDPYAYPDADRTGRALTWARKVMDFIAGQTGLINWEDNGVYRFSHRSFQEYLAARWMADHPDHIDRFGERIDDEDWRETILLAVGYLCKVRRAPYTRAIQVLNEFWPDEVGSPTNNYRALLLGEAFVYQLGIQRLGGGATARRLKERIIADLTALMQQPALTAYLDDAKAQARTRLAAGLLLADLEVLPPDLDDLVPGAGFRIGKYPVTNHQFKRFIDAGGYGTPDGARPPWWSEEGWEWRLPGDWTESRYRNIKGFDRSTQPVVGVSWYEAAAYCNWLTERWRAEAVITAGEVVRLPTQAGTGKPPRAAVSQYRPTTASTTPGAAPSNRGAPTPKRAAWARPRPCTCTRTAARPVTSGT